MKILHCIYDSIDNIWLGGGGALRTHAIYDEFPKDCEVIVLSGNYPGAKSKFSRQKFIGKAHNSYLKSRLSYSKHCRAFLKENHQDYDLIIEDFSPFSPLFSYKLVPQNKLLFILQNYFGIDNHKEKLGKMGYLSNYFEKSHLHSHQNIIFSSRDLEELVHKNVTSQYQNSQVINYGVDEDLFTDQQETKDSYFAFMGRLEIHQKGLDHLVESLKIVKQKHHNFIVKVAGKGKDEEEFKALINKANLRDNFEFIGFLNGEEKRLFLGRARAFIMPSRFESWGIVSLESQACQTPVIGTNIPGLRQTLIPDQTGFLSTSIDEFAQYVIQFIEMDSKQYQDMCSASLDYAKKFRWKPLAEKQLKYYKELSQVK